MQHYKLLQTYLCNDYIKIITDIIPTDTSVIQYSKINQIMIQFINL